MSKFTELAKHEDENDGGITLKKRSLTDGSSSKDGGVTLAMPNSHSSLDGTHRFLNPLVTD